MDSVYIDELRKRINEILLYVWNPIGIEATSKTSHEYETYAGQVLELVLKNAGKEEVSDYLSKVVQEQLGLDPNQEHNDIVAVLVCDWKDTLQKAQQQDVPASATCYISADKVSDTEYWATDISDKLADFLNFEYVDALNKEWQIWIYPSGTMYDVRPDTSFSSTDPMYYSHPGDGGWNIELVKNKLDKSIVHEAYSRLKNHN